MLEQRSATHRLLRYQKVRRPTSSTSGLNAYGNRKLTTSKGQPAFRRVTKGYLSRDGRGRVKRRGGDHVPTLPPVGPSVWARNEIQSLTTLDLHTFPAFRKLERLSTHKQGITIRGAYPRSDPFFRLAWSSCVSEFPTLWGRY